MDTSVAFIVLVDAIVCGMLGAAVGSNAVVFDDAANANFPTSPFTAEYGIEEDALKHIRAIYCYNKLNGFSELRYYETNAWEGKPRFETI